MVIISSKHTYSLYFLKYVFSALFSESLISTLYILYCTDCTYVSDVPTIIVLIIIKYESIAAVLYSLNLFKIHQLTISHIFLYRSIVIIYKYLIINDFNRYIDVFIIIIKFCYLAILLLDYTI